MKTITSVQEDRDEAWEKYKLNEANNIHPAQDDVYGKSRAIKNSDMVKVTTFCIRAGCNVFHKTDMTRALISIGTPFSLTHWYTKGRDRYCELKLLGYKDARVSATASGYGTGDYIEFTRSFPEEVKIKLLRELSIQHTRQGLANDRENERELLTQNLMLELLWNHTRSLQDLYLYTELLNIDAAREVYQNNGRMPGSQKKLADLTDIWNALTKTPQYKNYMDSRIKVVKTLQEAAEKKKLDELKAAALTRRQQE